MPQHGGVSCTARGVFDEHDTIVSANLKVFALIPVVIALAFGDQ